MKNYKFLTSNNTNNFITSNQSYSSSIKNYFTFLNEEFYTATDPMIAGSFILRNLFSKHSPYEDIDFYFKTEEQRDIANKFFKNISVSFKETKFAITYSIGTRLKIQVIKEVYSTPISLITSFDITPAMICFEPKNESFTYEIGCLYSWYRKTISLNQTPLSSFFPLNDSNYLDAFLYFNLLSRRIQKYSKRYSFTVNPELTKMLTVFSEKISTFTKSKKIKYTYFITNSSGSKEKINIDSSNIDSYLKSLIGSKNEKKTILSR